MKKILFQGDSITDCRRIRDEFYEMGRGYACFVAGRLGYDFPNEYEFINRGIGGNRISDVYVRIKSDIINLAPDYMSILIGVNDVWHDIDHNNGIDNNKFKKLYTMLLEEIFEVLPDVKVMIMEPFVQLGSETQDNPEMPDRWHRFDYEVRKRAESARLVAEKFNLPFVSLQDRFDHAYELTGDSVNWTREGVHPTEAGNELIARAWIDEFMKMR